MLSEVRFLGSVVICTLLQSLTNREWGLGSMYLQLQLQNAQELLQNCYPEAKLCILNDGRRHNAILWVTLKDIF